MLFQVYTSSPDEQAEFHQPAAMPWRTVEHLLFQPLPQLFKAIPIFLEPNVKPLKLFSSVASSVRFIFFGEGHQILLCRRIRLSSGFHFILRQFRVTLGRTEEDVVCIIIEAE